MKYWKYSLWLSIFSLIILVISALLPTSCSVFVWSEDRVGPGVLFPVFLAGWLSSLFAVAISNIFINPIYSQDAIKIEGLKKYTPTLLSIPGLVSFLWFCCRWLMGKPMH